MCKHMNIKPIVELNSKAERVVCATVCIDCFEKFPVSPITYKEYLNICKQEFS